MFERLKSIFPKSCSYWLHKSCVPVSKTRPPSKNTKLAFLAFEELTVLHTALSERGQSQWKTTGPQAEMVSVIKSHQTIYLISPGKRLSLHSVIYIDLISNTFNNAIFSAHTLIHFLFVTLYIP